MPKTSIKASARKATKDDAAARKLWKTADSIQNFVAGLGIGTDNIASATTYGFNPISRIRTLLEWIHRGSWLGGVAIDIVADDMTKMGVDIRGELEPEQIEKIEQAAIELQLWPALNDTVKWSRLYGGCIAVMMIDGQNLGTPLRIETVGKGAFRGLLVLDRWSLDPSLNDLVTEFGPDFGNPKYYRVTTEQASLPSSTKIHYTRLLRLEGIRLPYWQRIQENLWGISVIERLYDRMIGFDSATQGMAQLIYRAFLRTMKIKGLREAIGTGGDALAGVLKWVDMMRSTQSNEGVTLLDGEDDFAIAQHSAFGGLAECVLQMAQQLSGALQIPLTRIFGQSPAGLNSTGESDIRTYYDGIKMQQERTLKVPLTRIYQVLARSLGIPVAPSFAIEFRPLWQLTDVEKVSTAGQLTTTVTQAYDAGIIDRATALKELRQGSKLTGVFTNITDEEIEAAEDEPLPGSLEDTASRMELQQAMAPEEEGDEKTEDGIKLPGATRVSRPRSEEKRVAGLHQTYRNAHAKTGKKTSFSEFVRGVDPANHKAVMAHEARITAKDQMLGDRRVLGFDVVVEHERGDERYGRKLPADYGYLRRTDSAERGDQMDVFVGEGAKIFIVDSYRDLKFDEHKIMLGFDSGNEAQETFANYYANNSGYLSEVGPEELKRWLAEGDVSKPYAQPTEVYYEPVAKNPKKHCEICRFYLAGHCSNAQVARDPKVPTLPDGSKVVSPAGWCTEFTQGETK